ncbi:energy transducer TonB [Mesorhizobium sp. B2-3-12]|uniref:energy transducer TonB family protein n=1 Tax=Mesorhizobium sp. B2-3-12 TaxID=2589952 RepID=UPI001FED4654|nr:energy transducer TonB [Mesorhizobium sp. B2-3-12]
MTSRRRPLQFPPRDMQEISPLPDAGDELAIVPAEPIGWTPPAAKGRWPAAIVASCLLHAGVVAAFLISPKGAADLPDTAQSQGSDQAGDKVAGSALDRESQAMNVTLVPNPQPAKPAPSRPASSPQPPPARQAAASPEKPLEPSQPVREAARPPSPEPARQASSTPDILVTDVPRDDNQSVAAKIEEPAQPEVQPETPETVAAIAQPPVPSPRPSPPAVAASEVDDKRGTADGQVRSARTASKGKKQKEVGSATEDSYRSDVIRKLSGVNRAVPPAVQLTALNNAVVTFVIGSRGGIDDLRILQSSGSPNFDQVVLGIVRKAAPFPPIPPKVGNSLVFTGAIGPF